MELLPQVLRGNLRVRECSGHTPAPDGRRATKASGVCFPPFPPLRKCSFLGPSLQALCHCTAPPGVLPGRALQPFTGQFRPGDENKRTHGLLAGNGGKGSNSLNSRQTQTWVKIYATPCYTLSVGGAFPHAVERRGKGAGCAQGLLLSAWPSLRATAENSFHGCRESPGEFLAEARRGRGEWN